VSTPRPGAGTNGLSAEERCLLLLARGTLSATVEESARPLLAQPLAWSSILSQADLHGLLPLLSRNLESLGFPGVPLEVRRRLESERRLNAARNALLIRDLTDVLGLLGEAGVPAIPLKGVALAASLYGDPGLRVCTDLDVLVPRAAATRAFTLLLANGHEDGEDEPLDLSDADLLLESGIEYNFVRRRGAFASRLELHWDIAWRWQGDGEAIADLWRESRPETQWGVPCRALSAEWQLLYLALHASLHRWQILKWLVDIDELCASHQVDWDRTSAKAASLGWEEVLRLTLTACHSLFGTPVPSRYRAEPVPPWLQLFPVPPGGPDVWDALRPARLFRHRSEKLRYLLRRALVPTMDERRFLALPSGLRVLYYPLRPLRLGCKWGWRSVRAGLGALERSS
jgi:hypothetical protein